MNRERFLVQYTAWRCQNGLQSEPKIPTTCGVRLDIVDLWTAVQSEGGSRRVSECRRWAAIGRRFNPPATMTNFSHRVKNLFVEHLLEYERSTDPDRAMPKPTEVANNQSSKTNSMSPTLFQDASPSQASSGPMKRPRSPPIASDLPFPNLGSAAFGRLPPFDLSDDPVAVLTLAYVQCESLLKFLSDSIEKAKIKKQKSRRINKPDFEKTNTEDRGDVSGP